MRKKRGLQGTLYIEYLQTIIKPYLNTHKNLIMINENLYIQLITCSAVAIYSQYNCLIVHALIMKFTSTHLLLPVLQCSMAMACRKRELNKYTTTKQDIRPCMLGQEG